MSRQRSRRREALTVALGVGCAFVAASQLPCGFSNAFIANAGVAAPQLQNGNIGSASTVTPARQASFALQVRSPSSSSLWPACAALALVVSASISLSKPAARRSNQGSVVLRCASTAAPVLPEQRLPTQSLRCANAVGFVATPADFECLAAIKSAMPAPAIAAGNESLPGRRTCGPALFVGGHRRSLRRRPIRPSGATSMGATAFADSGKQHRERRAIGAKLRMAMPPPDAFEPSFDASRVRQKLQGGLSARCNFQSRGAREARTPSTSTTSLSVTVAGSQQFVRNSLIRRAR